MKRQSASTRRELLHAAGSSGAIVRIHRTFPGSAALAEGIVLLVSDDLVLLHHLSSRIDLDGYDVLRIRDITAVETVFEQSEFFRRALELKGERATVPAEMDLSSMAAAIATAAAGFPLITISREREFADEVAIGRVRERGKTGIRLDWITPAAALEDDRALYRYSAITRLEFGGEYEQTLALVAGLPREGG